MPSNCQCYLFWNKDSDTITKSLSELYTRSGFYPCPSYLEHSKNSADGNLLYCLGKLVDHFSFILIIHGNDKIYNEIIETVNTDYGNKKIADKHIPRPSTKDLQGIFREAQQRNLEQGNADSNPSIVLSERKRVHEVIDIVNIQCRKCSKAVKKTLSLYQHVKDAHNGDVVFECLCSFKITSFHALHRHQLSNCPQLVDERQRLSRELIKVYVNPQYRLLHVWTSRKNKHTFDHCHHRYFQPDELFLHLQNEHAGDTDVRIQCCDPDVKYSVEEFDNHIRSHHSNIDAQ